jgi:Na+/H+ antiporter NhaD/arsenite permease-like protein
VPVAAALLLTYGALRWAYPAETNGRRLAPAAAALTAATPLDRVLCAKTLVALALTLALFVAGMAYPLAALLGASLIVVIGRVRPRQVFVHVDWNVLLFFSGLFVVMGAFAKAGYVARLLEWVEPAFANGIPTLPVLSAVTVLFSNLVSNVPAVILMQPLIEQLGSGDALWVLLALASTFAGNLTLVGSVANLIVAEQASAQGIPIGFWAYLKVGFPLTVAATALGTFWLTLI